MHRRDRGLTEKGAIPAAGTTILRNPGVALVWSSRTWHTFTVPTSAVKAGLAQPGSLIDVGEPTSWSWWAEGRPATHDEVDASIQSGMPLLMDQAVAQGTGAVAELARMAQAVLPLLPEPVPA
jgi:phytoene dehydrogenase-like protein